MSFEKTTPELIFELGNGAQLLTSNFILGRSMNELPHDVVKRDYDAFKARATKVGVWPELPELPESIDQFLPKQANAVLDHIKVQKTRPMEQLYHAGKIVQQFFIALGWIEEEVAKETPDENWLEIFSTTANRSLRALFEHEESLEVGIGDQLKEELKTIRDKYVNRQIESVDGLKERLRKQLCGLGSETSNLTPHASSMYN